MKPTPLLEAAGQPEFMKVLRKAKSTDFLGVLDSEVKDYRTGTATDNKQSYGCNSNRSKNSQDKTSIHNRLYE